VTIDWKRVAKIMHRRAGLHLRMYDAKADRWALACAEREAARASLRGYRRAWVAAVRAGRELATENDALRDIITDLNEEYVARKAERDDARAVLATIAAGPHDRDPLGCAVDVDGTRLRPRCAPGCNACRAARALAEGGAT
jgi:hypothetical protein